MNRSAISKAILVGAIVASINARAELKHAMYYGPGGNDSAVATYEAWLGGPLDYIMGYGATADRWSAISGTEPGYAVNWFVTIWEPQNRGRVIVSQPMLPADGSGTLAEGATGAYDTYWKGYAQKLIAAGYGNCIIRLGWEFNSDWFDWSARTAQDLTNYKNYWIKTATAIRSVASANFRFNWCGNIDYGKFPDPSLAFPGNAYVDEIGVDVYDVYTTQYPIPVGSTPAQIAARQEEGFKDLAHDFAYDLDWWDSLADAKGLPMTIPEWGMAVRPDGNGGGDNPIFIKRMRAWMDEHGVSWHAYFHGKSASNYHAVFDDADPDTMSNYFPVAGPVFKRLFSLAKTTAAFRIPGTPAEAAKAGGGRVISVKVMKQRTAPGPVDAARPAFGIEGRCLSSGNPVSRMHFRPQEPIRK